MFLMCLPLPSNARVHHPRRILGEQVTEPELLVNFEAWKGTYRFTVRCTLANPMPNAETPPKRRLTGIARPQEDLALALLTACYHSQIVLIHAFPSYAACHLKFRGALRVKRCRIPPTNRALRAFFGLFRSNPVSSAQSQDQARRPDGQAWPTSGSFPFGMQYGGPGTFAQYFPRQRANVAILQHPARANFTPRTHFIAALLSQLALILVAGFPPPFFGSYYPGIPPHYAFQQQQALQPFQPPNYPPPNYPPPNHPSLHAHSHQSLNPGVPALQHTSNGPAVATDGPKQESSDTSVSYPTGFVRREAICGQEPDGWKHTKWVWRSTGNSSHNGRSVGTSKCQGALICTECRRVTRPATQTASRDKQIHTGCTYNTCRRFGQPLRHQLCKARVYCYRVLRDSDNVLLSVWEHDGAHDTHERPPGGSLSQSERDQVDDQVRRHQTATVHQLRTGDPGPGSVPLADISPALANPRSARYHVSQSQARVGIPSAASSKGGLAFFQAFTALREKLTTPFIVDSSLNGPVYISFQTPFMEGLIKEAVDAWIADFAEGPEAGRHGFVTDGDMSFFRHGQLLASCVFNGGFWKWAPVLYTWIDQQDTAHHRAHFRRLFQSVIKYAGKRFDRQLLLNVMDFSSAQRAAHAEEYADAVISTIPGFSMLDKVAQDAQRKALVEEAQSAEVGCDLHFGRSATRIKKNGALVPRELVDTFDSGMRRLLSRNTTREEFDLTVATVKTTFPLIHGWVNWWLRPAIASMIFPALSFVDPDLAAKVPSTTNAIEHQHSLLHHATGNDKDLVPGAESIWLHVRELEKQFEAIKAGHFNAVPPRSYRPPRVPQWAANDGRAPDTAGALEALQGSHSESAMQGDASDLAGLQLLDLESQQRLLQSYPWSQPNSCFFDNGLELWFRIWLLWDEDTRAAFKAQLPSQTLLSSIFYHCERRRRWVYGLSHDSTMIAGLNELGLGQGVVRATIFKKWGLYADENEYGCAKTWMGRAITEEGTTENVQLHFMHQHSVEATCPFGHTTVTTMSRAQPFFKLNTFDLLELRDTKGPMCTWSDYFASAVPRVEGGNATGGTTPVHEKVLPLLCSHPGCFHSTSQDPIDSQTAVIETSWPQVLQITPESGTAARIPNSHIISFPAATSGHVEYSLVGTISFRRNHWTSKIRIGHETFSYDDLRGYLSSIQSDPDRDVCSDEPGYDTVLLMYHRTSQACTTRRRLSDVIMEYQEAKKRAANRAPIYVPVEGETPEPPQSPLPSHNGVIPQEDPSHTPVKSNDRNSAPPDPPSSPWDMNCSACGFIGQGSTADGDTVQCDQCKFWSHVLCMSGKDSTVDFDNIESMEWICPDCTSLSNRTSWNDNLTGQYIVLKTRQKGKYYPAKVLQRKGGIVDLEWYPGNIYAPYDKPKTISFSISTSECMAACGPLAAANLYSKTTCGKIRWPIRLLDDAAENHSYKNPAISQALTDARGAVVDICLGKLDHPVQPDYQKWMGTKGVSEGKQAGRSRLFAETQFDLDILPGDYSLMEDHINFVMLKINAAAEATSDDSPLREDKRRISIDISALLFKLVILRVYLGRSSKDDFQIYYLARKYDHNLSIATNDPFVAAKLGRIIRYSTIPEQVLLAAEGVKDTRTAPVKSPQRCSINTQPDKTSESIPDGYLLASPVGANNTPYVWLVTSSPGLYQEVTAQTLMRPKPKPVWRPKDSEGPVDTTNNKRLTIVLAPKRARDWAAKFDPFGDSDDEMDADPEADMEDDEGTLALEPAHRTRSSTVHTRHSTASGPARAATSYQVWRELRKVNFKLTFGGTNADVMLLNLRLNATSDGTSRGIFGLRTMKTLWDRLVNPQTLQRSQVTHLRS
ncbi:hypothetical protein FB451DRAFT_1381426 [Mycena latifolia]|nr:hypothetical protein FB451DRAFT_1381426 [Mycena latifolia]